MTGLPTGPLPDGTRRAGASDVASLVDLERRTNTVALAHVFDPAVHRFPTADVEERWERLVADPGTDVVVAVAPASDDPARPRLVGVVSVGDDRVGHLLVEPERWGSGLGDALLDRAVGIQVARGRRRLELTCLVENHRARRFYARRGWREAGSAGRAPWPPYPRQLTCVLDLDRWAGGAA